MNTKELIDNFLKLQKSYAFTKRKTITSDRYVHIVKSGILKGDYLNSDAVLESLSEHIGHLPILASYFYPHLRNDEVDLGRVLIMLSIHDIGETVTGEIFAYSKTESDENDEISAAFRILNPSLHEYLIEYEQKESFDAKYARSIDIIAPNILGLDRAHINLKKFKLLGAKVDDIILKKRKYMEWNPLMLNIFDTIIEEFKNIESGKDTRFKLE